MTNASTYSEKVPPAFNKKTDDYTRWKKKFDVWEIITDVADTKRGGLLFLRLDDDTQDDVLETVTTAQLKEADGADKVITALNRIFQKDESVTAFEDYEDFTNYERPSGVSIAEYCHQFHSKYRKVKASGTQLSEHVLAHSLLKSANLSVPDVKLVNATINTMTYDAMKIQLKKALNSGLTGSGSSKVNIKSEPEELAESKTLYGAASRSYSRRPNTERYTSSNERRNNNSREKSYSDYSSSNKSQGQLSDSGRNQNY